MPIHYALVCFFIGFILMCAAVVVFGETEEYVYYPYTLKRLMRWFTGGLLSALLAILGIYFFVAPFSSDITNALP